MLLIAVTYYTILCVKNQFSVKLFFKLFLDDFYLIDTHSNKVIIESFVFIKKYELKLFN